MAEIKFINKESVTIADILSIKNTLETVFKYTQKVNIYVFLKFKSPVDTLGVYNYLFFIEVPYIEGGKNYFRTINNAFLNNLVFAIRKVTDPTIKDVKDGKLYTETGVLDFHELIDTETIALKKFIKENIPNVKFIDLDLYYILNAPNCPVKCKEGNLICNTSWKLYQLISQAVDNLTYNKGRSHGISIENNSCLSNFIDEFIEVTNERTNHGKLTKQKMDAISKEEIGKQMQTLNNVAGKKLGIITGKAGTGKTLALLRFMHNYITNGHHCRLLTFNNLLVMDIKLALRNIGKYTPINASITTLHKFFYDLYIQTPVCLLHMDEAQIDRLFAICHKRISKMVLLIEEYVRKNKTANDIYSILEYYITQNIIKKEEKKEMYFFIDYLNRSGKWEMDQLHNLAIKYENEKRIKFIKDYGHNAFLSGYRIIMEQLYLLFNNLDSFNEKFGIDLSANLMSVRQTEEFKEKYAIQYDKFIEQCKKQFSNEHEIPEELFTQYINDEKELCCQIKEKNVEKNVIEQVEQYQEIINTIKRKVNWSHFVLIDEAQDCAQYEKELLLELYGSSNIIVASGGKDQLIRTAVETKWNHSFGKPLNHEIIKLTHVSHRQKGNIVEFVNAFAEEFGLDTKLSVPDTIKNKGDVIIDIRKCITQKNIPSDIINEMKKTGEEYGCSQYESIMMLFPNEGYTESKCIGETPTIDTNDTISYNETTDRVLNIPQIDGINILDCTISSKSKLFKDAGQDKTRCLLYESCRGLEAWSVLCMALDSFFFEKQISQAASDYADETLGLFKDETVQNNILCEKYAAIQTLMALTRAMNTLYISFADINSYFACRILKIASHLPFVKILR